MKENSIPELYDSTVDAFPGTRKRQHATGEVDISGIQWTPFLGMGTLLVRSVATNESRVYRPLILFKGVSYAGGGFSFKASDDERVYEALIREDSDVLVRCQCKDFNFRFCHYDYIERSLQGPNRKIYSGFNGTHRANPKELPGMCKHILKLVEELSAMGLTTGD
jgi:hypothetical protein